MLTQYMKCPAVFQPSTIEDMFAGIMWLLAVVDDELFYKRRLPQIELWIF